MAELSQEQWAEVERLFQHAADLPRQERREFLERACPDAALRAEVASLLEYSGEGLRPAEAAIASAAAAVAQEGDPDQRLIGARLGPYRVEEIVGHGGMGAVYRASRDDAEFHQRVAIKLVRTAAESPSTLRRFRQERQILARLSHPNIARLLDGGSTPEGVPYLVMEFIEGEPITAWCGRNALELERRLRLFLQVCEAVECAHLDLVVHRDLKPANILVTKNGTPKLLDFGIAKFLGAGAEHQDTTLTGLQMMTPEYASPEQVRGETATTAADVYALGLILYELLTGRKAQEVATLTPPAIAHVVCHSAPPAPALLKPQLAGDLDNIIRMAIRKEPERRYATAGHLARDIERHLNHLPVVARHDSISYRAGKFLRRNRLAAAAAALVALATAGGFILTSWLAPRVPRMLQVVQLTQTGRAEVEDGVATDGSRVFFTERIGGRWSLAQVPVNGGTPRPLQLRPDEFQPDILDISPDGASLLIAGGLGHQDERPLWIVPAAGGSAQRVGDVSCTSGAWSRDGKILFGHQSALYQMDRDGRNLRQLAEVQGHVDSLRPAPAPLADVLRFSLSTATQPIVLWEARSDGSGQHPLFTNWRSGAVARDGEVSGIWMPGGKYYLFKSDINGASSIFSRREDRALFAFTETPPAQIYSMPTRFGKITPSHAGDRVFFVAGHERREVVRYDRRRGQFLPFLSGAAARWVDYSRDGKWVVYTTVNEAALWRSRPDGSEPMQLTLPAMHVGLPRWSPDGSMIAFPGGTQEQPGRLWVIPASGGPAVDVALGDGEPSWSADGKSLLFWCHPQAGVAHSGLYIVERATRKFTPVPGPEAYVAWSPNSRYIAGNWDGSQIRLFDFKSQRWSLLAHGVGLGVPMWSRDSRYLYYQEVVGSPQQPVFRVRIDSGKIDRVVDSQQIPQSNVTGYMLTGLAPGEIPIATLIRSNSDIYALQLDLPK